MNTDKKLMEWYMKGWNDELHGTSTIMDCSILEDIAYGMGASDCVVGDDMEHIDKQTEKEILDNIKSWNDIR